MNMFGRIVLAFVVVSSLFGCAVSVGPGEGSQKISEASQQSLESQFVVGTATKDDVAMQLGAPSIKSEAGSYEIWTYRYTKRAAVGIVFVGVPVGTTKTAIFYFENASGVLRKLEFESHQG
jgi:outer membrane protein assembly factor BamE (lipoprotein component of BamABCDE complex)